MPYPIKHVTSLALQIVEFTTILVIVYGICFIIFPAVYDVLVDVSVIIIESRLVHL